MSDLSAMISQRQLYLSHVAQTSEMPLLLQIDHAEGIFIYDTSGKRYYDMNSGISVSSLGHCHPKVVKAVQKQVATHMHTMVYGEHVHSPQVSYAQLLTAQLADQYQSLYYLMSGTEATELAMKIAKKHTGRIEIVACANAYHGSTQGAESLRSDEKYLAPFRPLLPGIKHIRFNNQEDLSHITCRTACVICEPVQGEAGVIIPQGNYLSHVQERCRQVGALFILDEIQTGFGRTGHLFAHQKYDILPDVILIGKAMGGGMPISGVVSSKHIMSSLVKDPALGHITTFGGHPVVCAAALATLQVLLDGDIMDQVSSKATMIHTRLSAHPIIKQVRHSGLMMAVEPTYRKYLKHIVQRAYEKGLLIDWFLFNNRSFRLAPPLTATNQELSDACDILLRAMDDVEAKYQK